MEQTIEFPTKILLSLLRLVNCDLHQDGPVSGQTDLWNLLLPQLSHLAHLHHLSPGFWTNPPSRLMEQSLWKSFWTIFCHLLCGFFFQLNIWGGGIFWRNQHPGKYKKNFLLFSHLLKFSLSNYEGWVALFMGPVGCRCAAMAQQQALLPRCQLREREGEKSARVWEGGEVFSCAPFTRCVCQRMHSLFVTH